MQTFQLFLMWLGGATLVGWTVCIIIALVEGCKDAQKALDSCKDLKWRCDALGTRLDKLEKRSK